MLFEKNDAPVILLFGQSNASGYGTKLPCDKQITLPLKNVFGLSRKYNQAYHLSDVIWSGFTTNEMNLGEVLDHSYCLAGEFARRWQAELDDGCDLPNLYVIHISISAQGICEIERDNLNMWYPHRKPILDTQNTNISLYPLAMQVLKAAMGNLRRSGKTPRVLGLHWNQWETEVYTGAASLQGAKEKYLSLFSGFREAIEAEFPIVLYRPLSEFYQKPAELAQMDEIFLSLTREYDDIEMIDLSVSPLWDAGRADRGVFQEDLVHYAPTAHKWFADWQMKRTLGR